MTSVRSVRHRCTERNPLLFFWCHPDTPMTLERLVVRIPERQKAWLEQQSTDIRSVSQVVREIIEEKIIDSQQKQISD